MIELADSSKSTVELRSDPEDIICELSSHSEPSEDSNRSEKT